MLLVISPAKKIEINGKEHLNAVTEPEMLESTSELVDILREKTVSDLKRLMDVSDAIAKLNVERYQQFSLPFTNDNANPALLTFVGDVYANIQTKKFSEKEFTFAQKHLRILSGLYGLLKPLDLIQPYRLEMGIKLVNTKGKNLYDFWGDKITNKLNEAIEQQEDDILLNLASAEYFQAVNPKKIKGKIITLHFKELRNGKYQVIGLNAKRARGMMVDFIVRNHLRSIEDIKSFNQGDYILNKNLSSQHDIVFTR